MKFGRQKNWDGFIKSLMVALTLGCMVAQLSAGTKPAPPPGEVLEDLRYRVDIWILGDALDARMTFRRLQPDLYRAKVTGVARGLLSLISGKWRGSFTTEMVRKEGKFLPLVYREESQHGSKRHVKEYRFDYDKNSLQLWKWKKGQGMVKKGETEISRPMYDSLSFYYNVRFGAKELGKAGGTYTFQGIPFPKKEEIVLRVGPNTPQGRKIMVTLDNRIFKNERSHVYAYLDGDGIPTEFWTDVLRFGRITGTLLPGGKRLKNKKMALSGARLDGGSTERELSPAPEVSQRERKYFLTTPLERRPGND